MLQDIAALGTLALEALKSLRLTRRSRTIIAKALAGLHQELSTLLANGDQILRMLRRHNRGKHFDVARLAELLEEQHVVIRRINTILADRKVKTALSLHAPQLAPLSVLVHGKGLRIELLRQNFNSQGEDFDVIPPAYMRRYFGRSSRGAKLPNDRSIDQARRELRKIRAQIEELRQYIVQNFELDEVL